MLFSIITPIWNDEKFLEEYLDSCLDQALSPEEFEIICVDDGSTDRTPEILQEYASSYPNIRVITKKHGSAYGFGRNIGFEAAKGEYVWFVDHDDIVAPNALVEIKNAVASEEGIDRIAFPYYEFFDNLTPVEHRLLQEGALVPNAGDALSALALWSGVIRRSFMKEHDIWPHSKRIAAAGNYWGIEPFRPWAGDNICMEECFDCGMRTKALSGKPLYLYRRHTNSQTMSLTPEMIETRNVRKYHAALLRAYLAANMKEQYLAERSASGQASSETTAVMIMKLRRCVHELNGRPRCMWSEGINKLKEKELFFLHKPPEYTFSFRDYFKTRTRKEKLTLSTYVYYYIFTLAGARWYRILTFFTRLMMSSPAMMRQYRKQKQERILKLGTMVSFDQEQQNIREDL